MKGIKHFVESLDLLLLARDWPGDPQLSSLAQTRARQALAVTADPEYHRLDVVDDVRFRQDSMSYLRACWLAEQFGWDTADYRRKIQRVLPRIHRHLPTRGIDQRMGFALLLRQLGFPQTETIASIWPETLLARHAPLAWYLESGDRPYDLTHEIFAMSWRGARSVPFPSPADARYARGMVRELLQRCLASGNLDLAGELLVNLAELEDAGGDLARRTRAFLFAGQNPDGSFGVYDPTAVRRAKRNPSYDVRIGGNLHTTMVVLWALITTA